MNRILIALWYRYANRDLCRSFLDGHNSTFKTLFQLKYVFKYYIFFANEQ